MVDKRVRGAVAEMSILTLRRTKLLPQVPVRRLYYDLQESKVRS